jgi:hypothetical protein
MTMPLRQHIMSPLPRKNKLLKRAIDRSININRSNCTSSTTSDRFIGNVNCSSKMLVPQGGPQVRLQ